MWMNILRNVLNPIRCGRHYSNVKNPKMHETHYDVLNLPRDCSSKDVRNAFLKLSKQYHPDRNKSKESQERFVKISDAYSVLSKTESRRNYDLGLAYLHKFAQQNGSRNSAYGYSTTKNPWDEFNIYRNYEAVDSDRYYGIKGVKKVSNATIAMMCVLFAFVGLILQIAAIRYSYMANSSDRKKRSAELSKLLEDMKKDANETDHAVLVQRLEQRLKDNGSFKH